MPYLLGLTNRQHSDWFNKLLLSFKVLISRDGPCFSVAFLWYLTRALYRVSASYSFLKLKPDFNKFKTTKPLQTLFVWRSCLFCVRFSSISWICVFIHTWDLELMEETNYCNDKLFCILVMFHWSITFVSDVSSQIPRKTDRNVSIVVI